MSEGSALEFLRREAAVVDPEVRLVGRRVFRRFAGGLAGSKGTTRAIEVASDTALRSASREELGFQLEEDVPARLWLLRVDRSWRVRGDEGAASRRLWMALMARAIGQALDLQRDDGLLDDAEVAARVEAAGAAGFREALAVLLAEGDLEESASAYTAYRAVAANYLALVHVEPARLWEVFPGLEDRARIESVLTKGLDGDLLAARTRPRGATAVMESPSEDEAAELEAEADEPIEAGPGRAGALSRRAERAKRRGNDVRAAIAWTRTGWLVDSATTSRLEGRARGAIASLAERLARAVDDPAPGRWRQALEALREPAARGPRSGAARTLFSLQKACVDRERPAERIDLVGWVLSAGRRPLGRSLPSEWLVRRLHHLRQAIARLGRARVDAAARRRLSDALHEAIERAEEELRAALRPRIGAALREAGLVPANMPEAVGESKLVEELLDRAAAQGFITAGELRDALARNPVKLPDLTSDELVRGDRYLQADRGLGRALEGVYRGAEVYLRGLQKASSLSFGTVPGRWLTMNVVLPFGGAFVVLEGLQHLVEPAVELVAGWNSQPIAGPRNAMLSAMTTGVAGLESVRESIQEASHSGGAHAVHLMTAANVTILGLFVLLMLRWAGFRSGVVAAIRQIGRGLRVACIDVPRWLVERRWVAALMRSRWAHWAWRLAIKPGLPSVLVAWFVRLVGGDAVSAWVAGLIVFLIVFVVANTRIGRILEEELVDGASRAWTWLGHDFFPGLVRATLRFFHRALERLDQFLFAVDEFFRFRAGDARWTLGLKAVGGAVWAGVRYLVRLVVNLLIEPQVNPIKHFPVVTVAHKITLPFLLALAPLLMAAPLSLGRDLAYGIAFLLQLLLPGVFGFLVWELKENWKLYAANRPRSVRQAIVGSHGETMTRLLRPGFHSGTIPRAYRTLRRAANPEWSRHRHREALHHIDTDVRRFFNRELIGLLARSRSLRDVALTVSDVTLTTTTIQVAITRPDRDDAPLIVRFEEWAGWLVADLGEPLPGWVNGLEDEPWIALSNGLAGLYARSGVDVVGHQVRLILGAEFRMRPEGLVASKSEPEREWVKFDLLGLDPGGAARRRTLSGRLLFSRRPIAWSAWVDVWEREAGGGGGAPSVVEPPVLPERRSEAVVVTSDG